MIGHPSKRQATAAAELALSPEIDVRLVLPLYTHVGSVYAGHVAGLVLGGLAMARIGGAWPASLESASLALLALRVFVLREVRRIPAPASAPTLLRWRLPYQAVGIAWCAVSAALCGLCIVVGDELLRLFAVSLIFGTTSGIASRNAGSPRFALIEIALWLLPGTMVARLIDSCGWVIPVMIVVYAAVLRSIVWGHWADRVAMIEAERTSQESRTALGEREAALQALFDNVAASVIEVDLRTHHFTRVNRVFCDLIGWTEAELLGVIGPTSFVHPDDKAEQSRQWAAIQATGRSFQCERRYIRSNGTIVWAHLCVSVSACDSHGRPVRLVSIFQDITERKAAEAALRASQNLLVLALEIGSVGTFRRDYVAGLIHCARETRAIIGVPFSDAPVPAACWLETVVPEDRIRLAEEAAAAHRELRPIVTFEYRFIHPDKGLRYAETRSRIEYNASGLAISSFGVVIDVTDRRRTESRLKHLAHHDPLTDLPNRSLFRIRLDAVIDQARRGRPFAILYLDIDHFKDVNDTLGHSIGDGLLQAVTVRLRAMGRSTDTVARLGGDEFAIIQSPLDGPADAAAFAERITDTLAMPYTIEGHHVVVGTSIGIAIAPDDGLDADHLLRNADMALYGAKGAGRGRYRFFEPEMQDQVQARRALDGDLREALADGAFELFYQPLVAIATQEIRGFEALIRWRHPERGLIMPDAFIPQAESSGLIVPIGAFVLNCACAHAALWPEHVSVAVNLSASEFASPNLFGTIASALHHSGLDPRRLELEITETTMLQDTRATITTLNKLKALGVRLSIDDFGTGFSSLGYLQRFPFDKVKIDRSFIAPLGQTRESLAIVGAVVNLCAGLDMETTAEGVETQARLAILSELGCTEAQGYYFNRPRPSAEIPAYIAQQTRAARRTSPPPAPRTPAAETDPRKADALQDLA